MPRRKAITNKAVQSTEDKPFDLPAVDFKPEQETDGWGADGLTIKQRAFVHYYMGESAGNATNAAERAGYKSDNRNALAGQANYILRNVNVQRALEQKIGEMFGKDDTGLINGVAAIANANAAAWMIKMPNGKWTFDLDAMAEAGALGLIKEIHNDGFVSANGDTVIVKQKIKLYDRVRAYEILAKIKGLMVERREISGPNGGAIPVTHKMITDDDILASRGVPSSPTAN